nr:transcriptional protein SWT1 isoform X1 [Zootoca vivipara]XP_034977225.1 transcriptional protein SWT1 isoform X1 [Zootoca vivipara]XP_034977226.1 transcriptional protein SWT1 isoform X1 [Zootoca vivipara]XP_034977227.1 transcriptional protein SWT1 isoform X1 [Zootoca vivipara]
MYIKRKKESSKKEDISDTKASSEKRSHHPSSSSSHRSEKSHEKTEIRSHHAKEQPTSKGSDDSAGYTKRKRSLDLKDTTKIIQKEASKAINLVCGTLRPIEEREKVTMHFKKKAECEGKTNSLDSAAAFPRKEGSNKGMCSDPDVKRGKRELQDLRILNSQKKKKKKVEAECAKLKQTVKRVLELKETSQNTSKKSHPIFSSYSLSGTKLPSWQSSVRPPEGAQHASLELPRKTDKGMKCAPLHHLHELYHQREHKQKEQFHHESRKNIGNARTQGDRFEPAAFQMSQSSEASCHSSSCEAIESTDTDQEMQIVEELHAARIDKTMALPVVQTCGELTNMEIDLPDDESNMSARTLSGLNSLIVIDTNIMISHLEFIKSLKNTDIPGVGRFVLVIPWVVLQELDNLKRGKILAKVGQKAIPAVHFIYTCLKNQDPRLWGQSMQLASQQTRSFCVENNDDRVLQCCLQYQNLFPQAEIVLMTDDKNLCSKALVSEVKALSKADFVTALQKLTIDTIMLTQDASSGQSQSERDTITKKAGDKFADPVPRIIVDIKESLQEVLSCILETEMKNAFGDLWEEMVYHHPPWTLTKVLECYKRHWMAVFGMVISRNFLSTIEYLHEHLCKDSVLKPSTVNEVLQVSKTLLEEFSSRSEYDGILPKALAQVNKLLKTLEKPGARPNPPDTLKSTSGTIACEQMEDVALTQHTQDVDTSLSPKPLAQGNRHVEIWSVLESVWSTINLFSLELFQKLDLNTATTTQNMHSFKDAFVGLQKLMAAVSEILAGIRQVLVPNSSFQDVWALYSFLTNNKMHNNTKFTAEELYDCISQEVYRDRLSVGCCQLAQLDNNIKQCYESVCLEIKNRGWL